SHFTIVPGDFLPECAAHSLQYAAFDLVAQALGVGDRSTIVGDDKPPGVDRPAGPIHFHFGDERSVSVVALVGNTSDTASADGAGARGARFGRGTRIPVRRPGGGFHHVDD